MSATDASGGQVEAGWYPDPAGDGQRYWDGERWTEHVHSTAVATANEETFRAKLERAHTWEGALGFAAPRNWAQDRIEAAQGKPPFERAAIATGSFVTALVWGIGLIYYWLIGWAVWLVLKLTAKDEGPGRTG